MAGEEKKEKNMRMAGVLVAVVLLAAVLSGCGETFNGIGKDTSRIWNGTKTVIGVE